MTTETTTAAKPERAGRAKASGSTPPTPAPSASPTTSVAKPTSKSDTVIKLLLRAKGATPLELITATDWQPHSLRAFLSGLRKKGRVIVREERKGGGYAYRIVVAPAPVTSPPAEGPQESVVAAGTANDTAQA